MGGVEPGAARMSRGMWVLVGCAVTAIVVALVGQVTGLVALLAGADEPVASALPSPVAAVSVSPSIGASPSVSPSAAVPSPTVAAPKPSPTKAPAPPPSPRPKLKATAFTVSVDFVDGNVVTTARLTMTGYGSTEIIMELFYHDTADGPQKSKRQTFKVSGPGTVVKRMSLPWKTACGKPGPTVMAFVQTPLMARPEAVDFYCAGLGA